MYTNHASKFIDMASNECNKECEPRAVICLLSVHPQLHSHVFINHIADAHCWNNLKHHENTVCTTLTYNNLQRFSIIFVPLYLNTNNLQFIVLTLKFGIGQNIPYNCTLLLILLIYCQEVDKDLVNCSSYVNLLYRLYLFKS